MLQRRRQEEHRQQEAQRLERDRRLQTSLTQEEDVRRRRYVRQVQEELKERRTENALLQVHYTCLMKLSGTCSVLFFFVICVQLPVLCLAILNQSRGNFNSCLLVGRGGEVKQSKTTSTRGENG